MGGEKLQQHNAPRLERHTETALGERGHKRDRRARNRDLPNTFPGSAVVTWRQLTQHLVRPLDPEDVQEVLSALVLPDH